MKPINTIIKMTVVGVVLFALSACDKNNADNTDTAVPTQTTQQDIQSDGVSAPNDHAANPVTEYNGDRTNNTQTATPTQGSATVTEGTESTQSTSEETTTVTGTTGTGSNVSDATTQEDATASSSDTQTSNDGDTATADNPDADTSTNTYEDNGTTAQAEDNATATTSTETNTTTTGDTNTTGTNDTNATEGNDENVTDNGDDNTTTTTDVTPPVITLNGEANITLEQGEPYTELGATAVDAVDGNVSVTISGNVDTNTTGMYTVTYTAKDSSGNSASVRRTVRVEQRALPPAIVLTEALESALAQRVVPYDRMTLEINATSTVKLTVLNQTLANEQNRSIVLKGVDNNGTFYLYNVPLVKGANTIRLQAVNAADEMVEQNITVNADANQTIPLQLHADPMRGVGSLTTTITASTLLDAKAILFDTDGDGMIDRTLTPVAHSENNVTYYTAELNATYTQEGRYRPRVTVETREGLFFSSSAFALSLDVVSDANQKDPKGARPLDVAYDFKEAILQGDREHIERLLGNNTRLISLLYDHPQALTLLQDIYRKAQNWQVQDWSKDGRASVSYTFEVNGTTYGGGLELKLISPQVYTGREWVIDFIY